MRKLRRWAFNALTVLSLLLCIAMAGIWVRSYHRFLGVGWTAQHPADDDLNIYRLDSRTIGANLGKLIAQSRYRGAPGDGWFPSSPRNYRRSYFEKATLVDHWLDFGNDPYERTARFGGFGLEFPVNRDGKHPQHAGPHAYYVLTLPLWSLTVLFAILPSLSLLRLIRRRIPPGHCRHCGYNLHANLSGACPECGQPTAPAEPQRS